MLWLWVVLTLVVTVRLGLVEQDPRRNNVYLKVFAAAGGAFRHGEDLYVASDGSNFGFRYPPLAAVFFVPFAMCGAVLGSILWRIVSLATVLLALRACFRAGFPMVMSSRERGIVLLIVLLIGITSFNNGQVNPLMLGLFLFATTGSLTGRSGSPAAAIAACATFKVYPVVYGAVLGLLRPRQLLWLGLFLLAGAFLPFALQNPDYVAGQYAKLWQTLQAEDRTQGDLRNVYRDLRLIAISVGFTLSESLFQILQVLGGGAIAAGCLLLQRRGASARRVLEYAFSSTMCWLMLLGPATEKATYVWIAPSLAWVLVAAWRQQGRTWRVAAVLANGLALASLYPFDLNAEDGGLWRWCLLPYAGLVLAVIFALRAIGDLARLRRGA
ncbi:MAG: glycosyltransferase family 87 protein [Planctomycetota bacterium]